MKFQVTHNANTIAATARADAARVPFAVVRALTSTAGAMKRDLVDEMRRAFDRPTPYSLNSLFVSSATRANPSARVWLKDDRAGSGTPATKFLAPQIEGGTRTRRASERMLAQLLVLPHGWYLVPGAAARRDAYGNWSVGELRQVLSWFNAAEPTSGYRANISPAKRAKLKRGTRRRRGFEYFAVRPGDRAARWLQPGIYRKTKFAFGGAVQPIAVFVRTVAYPKRFRFFEVAEATARRVFPAALAQAQAEAARR